MAAAINYRETKRGKAFARPQRADGSPIDKAKPYEVVWNQVAPIFEATRLMENRCYVYFIGERDNGPVKIGVAKDPIARLRTMQTGNPRRLRLEHVLVGTIRTERLMHEMWTEYAIFAPHNQGKADVAPGTEWFRAEIRDLLNPILELAAMEQIGWIREAAEDLTLDDCEAVIRGAHGAFDFVAHCRESVRFAAAAGMGTVAQRRAYIRPR